MRRGANSDAAASTATTTGALCPQHMPLCTVREALEFSSEMRLPADVSHALRSAFVDEAMDLLELTALAQRKVRRCPGGALVRHAPSLIHAPPLPLLGRRPG